jgi:hypothetical protein
MSAAHEDSDRRTEDSTPRHAGEGSRTLRVQAQNVTLCLFNLERLAPQLPDACETFARAVAAHPGKQWLQPPAPGTRIAIEDQDGNLLAYAVIDRGAECPTFTLYRPSGERVITWPPAGRIRSSRQAPQSPRREHP